MDSKDIIALKLESKGNGVYEVTPRETLEMGKEYAFYYRQKEEDKSNPFYGVFDFVVKE